MALPAGAPTSLAARSIEHTVADVADDVAPVRCGTNIGLRGYCADMPDLGLIGSTYPGVLFANLYLRPASVY